MPSPYTGYSLTTLHSTTTTTTTTTTSLQELLKSRSKLLGLLAGMHLLAGALQRQAPHQQLKRWRQVLEPAAHSSAARQLYHAGGGLRLAEQSLRLASELVKAAGVCCPGPETHAVCCAYCHLRLA
jgi:hypothetical protein